MIFRRFTKEDWYGWAGASKFPNGDEPLVAEVEFRRGDQKLTAWVLIGGEEPGIVEVEVFEDDAQPTYQVSGAAALSVLVQIHRLEWLDDSIIAALGLKRIDA